VLLQLPRYSKGQHLPTDAQMFCRTIPALPAVLLLCTALFVILLLQLPRYSKGQHLRKVDARLWTQVWAEFTALHGEQMEAATEAKKVSCVVLLREARPKPAL
jgi:hypothetical protein